MKTTTLLNLLEYCDLKTLFLAFNESVQKEIQNKIDNKGLRQGKAMTIHSLGLSAIKKYFTKYTVKKNKNFDLVKLVQEKNKSLFKNLNWEDKLKLTYTLIDMNDISRLFLTNNIQEINNHLLSLNKSIFMSNKISKLWKDFIYFREKSYQNSSVEIDFTDMIYLPVYKDLEIPIDPYYLMVDKCFVHLKSL